MELITNLTRFLSGCLHMLGRACLVCLWIAGLLFIVEAGNHGFRRACARVREFVRDACAWIAQAGIPWLWKAKHKRPAQKQRSAFSSRKEALRYAATRIAEEARRQGEPLTAVEEGMLYFDARRGGVVEFSTANDVDAYEQKIARLARSLDTQSDEQTRELWHVALEKLSGSDMYLSALVSGQQCTAEPPLAQDRVRLFLAALAGVIWMLVFLYLAEQYLGPEWDRIPH